MDECRIENHAEGATYEELAQAMNDDLYWVRFFARPCCPAPDLEGAVSMLDRLASDVRAHGGFTVDEKQALCDLIEARKEWYSKSGLCRAKRSS